MLAQHLQLILPMTLRHGIKIDWTLNTIRSLCIIFNELAYSGERDVFCFCLICMYVCMYVSGLWIYVDLCGSMFLLLLLLLCILSVDLCEGSP